MTKAKTGIIGGGAWGTALAATAARNGEAILWARKPEIVEGINARHENKTFLPGVTLAVAVRATNDLNDVADCELLLLAVPAQHMRAACRRLNEIKNRRPVPLVICAKGIEQETGLLLGEVLADELPDHPVAVLSGPGFAEEVASGRPTALTLAADAANGETLQAALASRAFRLYLTDDVVGAQIGGAVKNVLAVACGIVGGRKLGDSARAALITRGLAEMTRLGMALGGRPETMMGLSGLGDLVLTCCSAQSRNTSFGIALGQGKKAEEILTGRLAVTEGVHTASAALSLAKKHGVDAPIVEAVDAILNRGATIDATIEALLARPLKAES